MKKDVITLLSILAFALTSYAQNWETIKNRGANGCYTTQIVETVEVLKKSALSAEKHHYDIKITFENALDVGISFNYRYKDAFRENSGRITLKPKEIKKISATRQIPHNSQLNIQPIEASELRYVNFEILGEKIHQSEYIKCLERFHLYRNKKQKEIRDKKENQNKSSDNITSSNNENSSSNNQSTSENKNSSNSNSDNNINSSSNTYSSTNQNSENTYQDNYKKGIQNLDKVFESSLKASQSNKQAEKKIDALFNNARKKSAKTESNYTYKRDYKLSDHFDIVRTFNEKEYASVANKTGLAGVYRWSIVNKYGVKRHKGTFESEPEFINGIARVNTKGILNPRYIFIDKKGNIVQKGKEVATPDIKLTSPHISSKEEFKRELKLNFDVVENTKNGFIVAKKNKFDKLKFGYINYKGEMIISLKMDKLTLFHEGLSWFTSDDSQGINTKYGYIDTKGNIIIKEMYYKGASTTSFINGLASVTNKKGYLGLINKENKIVVPFKYLKCYRFGNGELALADKKLKLIFFDKTGKIKDKSYKFNNYNITSKILDNKRVYFYKVLN